MGQGSWSSKGSQMKSVPQELWGRAGTQGGDGGVGEITGRWANPGTVVDQCSLLHHGGSSLGG